MKIVIVLLTHIDNLPPARNLLLSLIRQNIKISLITMYSYALPSEIRDNDCISVYDVQRSISKNKLSAIFNRFKRRLKVRHLIKMITECDDIIWTITDYDAMEVGKVLLNHRHVMQLMELIRDIPIFDEFPLFKANLSRYAKNAELVIVPEYNRAHIQRAYWNLQKLPIVLPNKSKVEINENVDISAISIEAANVFRQIGSRKIVLYQGTFGYERVLDQFIEAVKILGDDYCCVLMGNNDDELKKILKKYPETFFIPFIPAPNHLYVTKHAHIGVLSYVNTNNIRHYDPLNALYCAPNKIYEYAYFGVPMIGNDIPGLDLPFKQFNMGRCSELKADAIADKIREIENSYEEMSLNCRKFYNDINIDDRINKILHEISYLKE